MGSEGDIGVVYGVLGGHKDGLWGQRNSEMWNGVMGRYGVGLWGHGDTGAHRDDL